jgi:hypothetical protein
LRAWAVLAEQASASSLALGLRGAVERVGAMIGWWIAWLLAAAVTAWTYPNVAQTLALVGVAGVALAACVPSLRRLGARVDARLIKRARAELKKRPPEG